FRREVRPSGSTAVLLSTYDTAKVRRISPFLRAGAVARASATRFLACWDGYLWPAGCDGTRTSHLQPGNLRDVLCGFQPGRGGIDIRAALAARRTVPRARFHPRRRVAPGLPEPRATGRGPGQ